MLEEKVDGVWKRVGQTETIQDDLNPTFKTPLEITYKGAEQEVKFTMWDNDGGGAYEEIGQVYTPTSVLKSLAEDESNNSIEMALQLLGKPKKRRGDIIIRCSFA